MKAITKKEFTEECYKVIEELNSEELQTVSSGLKIMYFKLSEKELMKMWHLNDLAELIMKLTFEAEKEKIKRLRDNNNEIPY